MLEARQRLAQLLLRHAQQLGRRQRERLLGHACEHEDVQPDFLCLAKGISGGYLPLAATLTTEEIYAAFLGARAEMKHFFHGHTYTANPLACAVGSSRSRLLREETLANAQARIPELDGGARADRRASGRPARFGASG